MSKLMNCSVACMLLSIWAIGQISLMAISYTYEIAVLIEDAEAEEYTDYEDFLKKTKDNYKNLAKNCWCVVGAYVVTLMISILGVLYAKKKAREEEARKEDDELFCLGLHSKVVQKKKI